MKIERNLIKIENLNEKRNQDKLRKQKTEKIILTTLYTLLFLAIGIVW